MRSGFWGFPLLGVRNQRGLSETPDLGLRFSVLDVKMRLKCKRQQQEFCDTHSATRPSDLTKAGLSVTPGKLNPRIWGEGKNSSILNLSV